MMSRTLLALAGAAAAIALPSLAGAQAQAPLRTPPAGTPKTRTLICHGGPALQVRVHADPSPSWIGPASYPTKPVQMVLQFAGGALFTDADNLPAGSCAWKDWASGLGVPPGEVFVDVNHPSRPAPTPTSIRADLADAKRFYRFSVTLTSKPLGSFSGEWIPGAPSQASAPSTQATAAGPDPVLRQLMCRGGPSGFEFKVIADPSPAYADPPKRVRLAIHYRVHVASDTTELTPGSMSPGSCGWDMRFGAPMPPGHVIIDIEADAQASNATVGIPRDTSMGAGLAYPDTTTVKRFLSDPRHFWTFYHLDRGEPLAMSHWAHKPDLTNLFAGSVQSARTTASGTGVRSPTTTVAQGSTGSVSGSLRDAAPGSTTLSSVRVLADSQHPTVVRAPNTAGGSLRGGAAASTPGVRTSAGLPTGGGVAQPRPAPGSDSLLGARAVTAGPGPGDARTSRTLLPDVRIWGVATAPGPRGVRLAFNTDGGSAYFGGNDVRVQFSRQRPPWDSTSRSWAYPPGWDSPWLADISSPAQGGYIAEPMGKLAAGRPYYYLITVDSKGPSLPPRQVIGSFTASIDSLAAAPPAPGPEPASNGAFGDRLRADATDVTGALRDQPAGARTAAAPRAQRPDSAAPATSRTRLPPDVRIWGIETRPGNSGVKLSFQTDRVWVRETSGVTVQFSTREPRWEGGLLASPGVDSRAREVTTGWFEAEPHWHLQAGKRHYYLITVASNDRSRRPRQMTGSFLPAFP